jgi:hypothetical protein
MKCNQTVLRGRLGVSRYIYNPRIVWEFAHAPVLTPYSLSTISDFDRVSEKTIWQLTKIWPKITVDRPHGAQQRVYGSCGWPLALTCTFLNFVPASGTWTRFESAAAINTGRCVPGAKKSRGQWRPRRQRLVSAKNSDDFDNSGLLNNLLTVESDLGLKC